jgi:hypothetical protein
MSPFLANPYHRSVDSNEVVSVSRLCQAEVLAAIGCLSKFQLKPDGYPASIGIPVGIG